MYIFGFRYRVDLCIETDVSQDHTVSVFKAKRNEVKYKLYILGAACEYIWINKESRATIYSSFSGSKLQQY